MAGNKAEMPSMLSPVTGTSITKFSEHVGPDLSYKSAPMTTLPPVESLQVFQPERELLKENLVVGLFSRDENSRQFSLLRTQLLKHMNEKGWKIIGITSSAPSAGKSFVSSNLAASLARVPNQKVYLFDLDFRRASQARNFGIEDGIGLNNWLHGDDAVELQQIGLRLRDTQLSIYPCFLSENPSFELLATDRFAALIEAMRGLPEDAVVICDLPPTFANDDAMTVGRHLDAYMLVIEQGTTSKKQLENAMRLMSPTPLAGTVLNRYVGGFADPFGYGYGYSANYRNYYGPPG